MASIFFERKPFPETGCSCLSTSSENSSSESFKTCFKCFDLVNAGKSFPYRDPNRPTLARECGCNEVESCEECKDIADEDIKPEDYVQVVNPFTIIYNGKLIFSITQDGEAATYRTDAYRLLSEQEQAEEIDLLFNFLLELKDREDQEEQNQLLFATEISLGNIKLSEKNLVKLTSLIEKMEELETIRVLIEDNSQVETVNKFFDVAFSLPYIRMIDAEDSERCFDLCAILSKVISESKKRDISLKRLNLNNALVKFEEEEFQHLILFLEAETPLEELRINCNMPISMVRKGFETYAKVPIEPMLQALKDNSTVHSLDIAAAPQFRQYIANLGSRNMLSDISKRRRVL